MLKLITCLSPPLDYELVEGREHSSFLYIPPELAQWVLSKDVLNTSERTYYLSSSSFSFFVQLTQFFFIDTHCYFIFIYLFYYLLFLAVLGLRFHARAFSSCAERGPLFIAVRRSLTVAASPVAEHRLQTRRLSSCGSRA